MDLGPCAWLVASCWFDYLNVHFRRVDPLLHDHHCNERHSNNGRNFSCNRHGSRFRFASGTGERQLHDYDRRLLHCRDNLWCSTERDNGKKIRCPLQSDTTLQCDHHRFSPYGFRWSPALLMELGSWPGIISAAGLADQFVFLVHKLKRSRYLRHTGRGGILSGSRDGKRFGFSARSRERKLLHRYQQPATSHREHIAFTFCRRAKPPL
jgi:hypothetical protein